MCERAVGIIRMPRSIDKIVIHNVLLMDMRIEKKFVFLTTIKRTGDRLSMTWKIITCLKGFLNHRNFQKVVYCVSWPFPVVLGLPSFTQGISEEKFDILSICIYGFFWVNSSSTMLHTKIQLVIFFFLMLIFLSFFSNFSLMATHRFCAPLVRVILRRFWSI